MNILNIALNEIKRDFRDIRTFVFMLAFPIVLMLIMGTALTDAFGSNQVSVGDIHVIYKDQTNSVLSKYFQSFMDQAKKSGIHFKEIEEGTNGKSEIKKGHDDGYIELTNSGIQLYESGTNTIEASIIQGMLSAFVDKYNLAIQIAKVAPDQMVQVLSMTSPHDYIKEVSLHSKKQPGSMDYYAITMTTLIALYAVMSAIQLFHGERVTKTADRLMASPITKGELFLGKILGSLVTNSLCIFIVVFFSKFVFKANWGNHLGVIFLILITEVFLAISFGLGISYIAKTMAAARMIAMVGVNALAIVSGTYYKLSSTSGVASLSPLTWTNSAITKIIYANDLGAAIPAISLNIGVSVLFLIIAILSLQRREGL